MNAKTLLIISAVSILASGCSALVPGARRETFAVDRTLYLDALVVGDDEKGKRILCPSRIEVSVANLDDDCFMDLAIGSHTILEKLIPRERWMVIPPESPFRNGEALFTATLYRMEGGEKKTVNFVERWLPMNGPLVAKFTGTKGSIRFESHVPRTRWRSYR